MITMHNQRIITVTLLVIAILVIVLFIIHCIRVKGTPGNGGRVFVHGTYKLTWGKKTSQNPNYGAGADNCFYLNGVEAPTLMLKRGVYYEFSNETDEPIYFSSDPAGGYGGPGGLARNQKKEFTGLKRGTLFLRTTDDLPSSFYYQSSDRAYAGGEVKLLDH